MLHQVDINIAFLHGYLEEEVYMIPPLGYKKDISNKVCKLVKSLYGLKQTSRQWNQEFSGKLLGFGFVQSQIDNCLFIKRSKYIFLALLIYVDDVLIVGSDIQCVQSLKDFLVSSQPFYYQ